MSYRQLHASVQAPMDCLSRHKNKLTSSTHLSSKSLVFTGEIQAEAPNILAEGLAV